MSHMRISTRSTLSPQIPRGKAHMVVALEPTEALRVLHQYGNRRTKVIINTRPIYSVGVICGELQYPAMADVGKWAGQLSSASWLIDATDEAVKLGNAILGNVMLIGALAGVGDLPLDRDGFREVISRTMPAEKVDINLTAFEKGVAMVQ
jgi:indolepyruvate ferredoxin oxidoreductase beta subunit